MRKIVLTYGLIAGSIMAGALLVSVLFRDAIGFDRGALLGYTSMVCAFLLVYFGIRTYRDQSSGGRVSFGRAVVVGLAITGVASLCYVAAWELMYYKLTPDFPEQYAEYTLEKSRIAGATEAELAAEAKELADFAELYKNPLVNVLITLIEPLPLGVLFTLVSAGILSRQRT